MNAERKSEFGKLKENATARGSGSAIFMFAETT
jgi:hypothetical protein